MNHGDVRPRQGLRELPDDGGRRYARHEPDGDVASVPRGLPGPVPRCDEELKQSFGVVAELLAGGRQPCAVPVAVEQPDTYL